MAYNILHSEVKLMLNSKILEHFTTVHSGVIFFYKKL